MKVGGVEPQADSRRLPMAARNLHVIDDQSPLRSNSVIHLQRWLLPWRATGTADPVWGAQPILDQIYEQELLHITAPSGDVR